MVALTTESRFNLGIEPTFTLRRTSSRLPFSHAGRGRLNSPLCVVLLSDPLS